MDLESGAQSPKPISGKKPPRPQKQEVLGVPNLEDVISDFPPMGEGSEQLTAKFVRGIVKIARGLFAPGLHLNLVPTTSDRIIIGARLQEGRAYIDSDSRHSIRSLWPRFSGMDSGRINWPLCRE
jgi:hypothetical protein